MSPFTKVPLTHHAELKAVLLALLMCGLFIAFLTVVNPPSRRTRKHSYKHSYKEVTIPKPLTPNKLLEVSEPPPRVNSIEQFRDVPEHFKKFDFRNHSYGLYSFPNGRTIDLTLYGRDLSLPNRSGWFSLRDVYYTDVTGDSKAEAIVRLSHVRCAGSCDGGADLFYIYTVRNGKLKTLWQYETGSYGYGCGLSSFIASDKKLVLELFGRCPKQAMEYPGPSKFIVDDLTFVLFKFNGHRFVQETIEFFDTPSSVNVKSYEPSIHLF